MSLPNKKQKPNCPYCKKEMIRVRYQGYYDSFDYWDCECDTEIPIEHTVYSSP